MPSGNKFVCIQNRMGMKLTSKFNGTLVAKSQIQKLVKGMLMSILISVTGPTNTLKDGM